MITMMSSPLFTWWWLWAGPGPAGGGGGGGGRGQLPPPMTSGVMRRVEEEGGVMPAAAVSALMERGVEGMDGE